MLGHRTVPQLPRLEMRAKGVGPSTGAAQAFPDIDSLPRPPEGSRPVKPPHNRAPIWEKK